ncbi:hypothetical protein [Stenotrophomonas sp. C1657]|uniref:hypothetical protein n=1 Tax=Stenotrophomonas sp. C1657 TaxID=3077844 RepID=UPI00293D190C|nr:hypothetical protein [Stenotrophomonas sp. C1657]MDV3515194.1 hypothetical protein [Stenotrophomonas sp. C1657]
MRTINWKTVGWLGAAIVAGAGLSYAMGFDPVRIYVDKDAGQVWPAWVQALGSVGAILGAIGIAAYERSVTRKEAAERERRESDARFTRGNRAVMRFRKIMDPHLTLDRDVSRSHVYSPLERIPVPDAMLELEHDCHLMGEAGAACLNAVRCFENAQELIKHSMLRGMNGKKFFEQMDLAANYCDQASSHFVAYLSVASR